MVLINNYLSCSVIFVSFLKLTNVIDIVCSGYYFSCLEYFCRVRNNCAMICNKSYVHWRLFFYGRSKIFYNTTPASGSRMQ